MNFQTLGMMIKPFSNDWEMRGTPSRNSGESPSRFAKFSIRRTDRAPDTREMIKLSSSHQDMSDGWNLKIFYSATHPLH